MQCSKLPIKMLANCIFSQIFDLPIIPCIRYVSRFLLKQPGKQVDGSKSKSRHLVQVIAMTSGSDDLANLGYLGHFLMGQVGLIHKLKLCGCDLDVTCTLENSVGMWQLSELFSSHVTLL